MKKSVGLLAAAVMFIGVVFGNMVCYGAEPSGGAGEQGSSSVMRSVNTQSDSTTEYAKLPCGGHDIYITISLSYSWDEGYTGWFTGAAVSQYSCKDTSVTITSPSVKISIEEGTVTFVFYLTVDGVGYTGSTTYTVDEYGNVF